jgi:uracil phosphoribosyltransferase
VIVVLAAHRAQWGVPEIHVLSVIASRRGLAELLKAHPDVHVTLGKIDDGLSDDGRGDVLPGLGDAGDRLFGTGESGGGGGEGGGFEEEDDLVHVSKRKRTMSDLGN